MLLGELADAADRACFGRLGMMKRVGQRELSVDFRKRDQVGPMRGDRSSQGSVVS
jgi:hypothetical protein